MERPTTTTKTMKYIFYLNTVPKKKKQCNYTNKDDDRCVRTYLKDEMVTAFKKKKNYPLLQNCLNVSTGKSFHVFFFIVFS